MNQTGRSQVAFRTRDSRFPQVSLRFGNDREFQSSRVSCGVPQHDSIESHKAQTPVSIHSFGSTTQIGRILKPRRRRKAPAAHLRPVETCFGLRGSRDSSRVSRGGRVQSEWAIDRHKAQTPVSHVFSKLDGIHKVPTEFQNAHGAEPTLATCTPTRPVFSVYFQCIFSVFSTGSSV